MGETDRQGKREASRTAARAPITLCGSLSLHPVETGARIHNAGYRALALPYTYVPFATTPEGLRGALAAMRALGIRGLGVSTPFKIQIVPLLDTLDATAERVGAVNTVVNELGKLVGHNTDGVGAVRALEERVGTAGLRGRKAVLVGAGGAARAIAHGLVGAGAELTIVNRSVRKAYALSRDCGARGAAGLSWLGEGHDLELLVHATSVGMRAATEQPIVPASVLRAGITVMDIVYDPVETPLVRAARAAGAVVLDGSRMLLHQAARQFELYTGVQAPLEAMRAALAAHAAPADPRAL
jgi:shikimate dehydrogenase